MYLCIIYFWYLKSTSNGWVWGMGSNLGEIICVQSKVSLFLQNTMDMLNPPPSSFHNSLQEVHYCRLPSQSNVYGLATTFLPNGQQKLLVAALRGKVMSIEFQKSRPSSREVHFTYIPGMWSVSCYSRSYNPWDYHTKSRLVVNLMI